MNEIFEEVSLPEETARSRRKRVLQVFRKIFRRNRRGFHKRILWKHRKRRHPPRRQYRFIFRMIIWILRPIVKG